MRISMRPLLISVIAALGAGTACVRGASVRAAPSDPTAGISYRHIDDATGPWAIDVMEVDLSCWRPVAAKAGAGAIGRKTTSAILQSLADTSKTVVGGGVNADFFLFAPPGVPVGAHVSGGRVINGPTDRDAIWFDAKGRAAMGRLGTRAVLRLGRDTVHVDSWNRRDGAVRIVDRNWGDSTAAAPKTLEFVIEGRRIVAIDSADSGVRIPANGIVVQLDSTVGAKLRLRLAAYRGEVRWSTTLTPSIPHEALGGNPVIVRDSLEVPGLERVGGANFGPVRHPRTLVGVTRGGRHLLLVVVDGRREGWSAGMTLRELAALMLRLGARDAINLDGGGSTAMVLRQGDSLRVMNRPSDATGQRPVANALAVVRRVAHCDAGD